MNGVEKVNCFQCEFFAVSWDPKFPRTCKFYGFKSAGLPSVTVRESTGAECEEFVKKKQKNDQGAQL